MNNKLTVDVPCNGCIACCVGDMIRMHPECGDIPEFYETEIIQGIEVLKHQSNGWCIYLTKDGCGIHGIAPTVCREFDCLQTVIKLGFTRCRKLIKQGKMHRGVLQAAMRRM